jgi:hypothetical protein
MNTYGTPYYTPTPLEAARAKLARAKAAAAAIHPGSARYYHYFGQALEAYTQIRILTAKAQKEDL